MNPEKKMEFLAILSSEPAQWLPLIYVASPHVPLN